MSPNTYQRRFGPYFLLLGILCLILWITRPYDKILHLIPVASNTSISHPIDNEILLERMYKLRTELAGHKVSERIQQQIEEIVSLLGGKIVAEVTSPPSNFSSSNRPTPILEVCPEVWLGTSSDYPFYYKGWKQVNCSNVLPFEKVLTVLLYFGHTDKESCPEAATRVISGLRKYYPKLPVIVGGISKSCVPVKNAAGVLVVDIQPLTRNVSKAFASNTGIAWGHLVKSVTTPYVLIGRDLDDFLWTVDLEREVRLLSYNRSLNVAGGSVRNSTGHWRVGCFQTTMRNYILEYQEGYHVSKNECMFCDHLGGPFVTRTDLLKSIMFDGGVPDAVLFEDWFWRVHHKGHIIVNCPDVMYSASDSFVESRYKNRKLWMYLAQKYELNRIVVPGGRVFSYTCDESNITCSSATSDTVSFLMPICCVEQYAAAFQVFTDFCRENDLRYELDTGSALGAVKLNGLMPWDVDADNTFYTANYSFIKSYTSYFEKNEILLRRFERKKDSSYFCLYTPDVSVEMWGQSKLSHDNATFGEPFRLVPTLVQYHGYWVYAPHNPATFARGRYGPENLKHAHHWRHAGQKNSWEHYHPGKFNKCVKPGHHACLDQFNGDGNLQFRVPN